MNILDKLEEIKEKEKETLNKVMDFFSPLKKRYVSTTNQREIVKKKFLGIFHYTTEGSHKTEYLPLSIYICGTEYNNVYVRIITRFTPLQGDIKTEGDFPSSLFDLPDEEILKNELIEKFIKHFLCNATPKWMQYESFVNHIIDEEKKFFVADKLEELFELETFANLSRDVKDSKWMDKYVCDYIKTLENE